MYDADTQGYDVDTQGYDLALAHVYAYLERRLLAKEARVGMTTVMTAAHSSTQQHIVALSSTQQHTAEHGNTQQHIVAHSST